MSSAFDVPDSEAGLRTAAAANDVAPVALLLRLLRGPLADPERGLRHTLLAACPNSEAVARAALRAAQEARAPLLFAATLNQVDRDGGYVGWTPDALAAFVEEETGRLSLDVPVFLGLDHGGPWAKDAHVHQGLDYEAALSAAKQSIATCVEAGYDLLHLDVTADRRRPDAPPVPVETLVERTLELMRHAESARRAADRGPIAYEVGVEEEGDDARRSEERFRSFLHRLAEALKDTERPTPSFVVGDLGTTLGAQTFDAKRARRLAEAASKRLGAFVKGHYTDDVEAPELYPISGVGGANVGPGLTAVEARALRDLSALERRLSRDSGCLDVLKRTVVESERWRKWLRDEEKGAAFESLPDERKRWLVNTGSRYVWTDPAVEEARSTLYENVAPYRDADAFVVWRLKTAILRYMHAFNLVGLADRLDAALSDVAH